MNDEKDEASALPEPDVLIKVRKRRISETKAFVYVKYDYSKLDKQFRAVLVPAPTRMTLLLKQVWIALTRSPNKRKTSPVRGIVRLADVFGLGLRREIKSMAADFEVEIKRLRRERRPAMARWNIVMAWATAAQLCFLAVPEKLRGGIRTVLGFVAGYFLK
jgi:hypothetical protein